MAVKKTTNDIVTAYRQINNAKLTKMEDAEKFALIKIVRQLKKVSTDFDDFLKDAQEKLKPDEFDKIVEKVQGKKELSPEEKAKLNKYNKDVAECLSEELEKEVELDFEPLSSESLGHFIASNDFSLNDILIIGDVVGSDMANI